MPEKAHGSVMPDRHFMKNDKIVSRKIAGELFLIPIKGRLADMRQIFTLNPVGEYIWQALDDRKSAEEICKGIVSAFDVESERAESDLSDFIRELVDAGLLVEK